MGTIFVILMFDFSLGGGMSFEEHQKWALEQQKKRTSETVGTITEHKEVRGTKHYDYYVTYDFEVNGKTYNHQSAVSNGHPVTYGRGKTGKVCYDPKDLENASFVLDTNFKCSE
jgi:hypothetical protein